MTHIKKLSIQGFKSFAPKTEINFDKGINVIVGPNGSGKSNISDALCFVLGRLSVKSMRAAKAKNLLFMGSKYAKPAREASVEIVFDNSTKTFSLDSPEISLKRIVKHNGQSTYKINNEVKTRSEVIETLAQAGIDPHGFNLVLQGQIQSIVKTHPEERRKIIEEVAGISIYESRKEKSLKELEKTDSRLKEISTVLRERIAFLRNLEKERSQALKFKDLELTISRCKASILHRKISDKTKELESVRKSIEEKTSQKEKIKARIQESQDSIDKLNEEVVKINKYIQRSTGIEQESLRTQISNLRAEIEGLRVRKESFENRQLEIERRIAEMQKSVPDQEREISQLRKESPLIEQKQEELKRKKKELQELEEQKKQIYTIKTEVSSLKERVKDKENQIQKISNESDNLVKDIEEKHSKLTKESLNSCEKEISKLKEKLTSLTENLERLLSNEPEINKRIFSSENEISSAEKIKLQIKEIDVCPLCQNKMTEDHSKHVTSDSDEKIKKATEELKKAKEELDKLTHKKSELKSEITNLNSNLSELDSELSQHRIIEDKKLRLKSLLESENDLKSELKILSSRKEKLLAQSIDTSHIDEKYSTKLMEIEEISARTSEDIDKTLMYKERELEKTNEIIKLSKRDLKEIDEEVKEIYESIESKSQALETKEKEDKALNEKFKQMFKERDSIQEKIQEESFNLSSTRTEIGQIEEQINYLKVGNAKISAEKEAIEMELTEFNNVELISGSLQFLDDKLKKSQESIKSIGAINMRALEMYDGVKEEYDKVQEKVDTLEKEKNEILNIISEIDSKKKRTFMKTFKGINELFTTNFSKLSSKGQAFLELENKEDIFDGGVSIVVKLGKGKYFDVTSLSGGEQTLIAISLLFAIQEYRPYHFYILDEIDAALDKRNAERLSALLKKYLQNGQYIVITHNDALIMDSNLLYGVSMHDGVSKVLGLKI